MKEAMIINLIHSGYASLFFLAAYAANMVFSTRYNTKILKEPFDWTKILDSLINIATIILGTVLLITVITGVPLFLVTIGMTIPEEYIEVFNIMTIIGAFMKQTFKYAQEAVVKLNGVLDKKILDL